MKKYSKLFNNHSEYNTYISGDRVLPNVSYCLNENEVHYNPWTWAETYLTFVALEDGTFSFTRNNIQYSTDNGETWTTLTAGESTPTITTGTNILWKCNNPTSDVNYGIGTFSSTGNFEVKGNIISLIYGDNFRNKTDLNGKKFVKLFSYCDKLISAENLSLPATTLTTFCYNLMFSKCTSLTTAPELPATTLIKYCYCQMFQGCTSLTIIPSLPATTLAESCYLYMFSGCKSLTTVPELPATTLAESCYLGMFEYCTLLTITPVLPITTLARACYAGMFTGCTSLVTAPELPATTLIEHCYSGMFRDCTSLTTAPELPATILKNYCYQSMFYGCTSLTAAPELPATTLVDYCYNNMFKGCTLLNYIKAMFTNTPNVEYSTYEWVKNTSATGTFVKNSAAEWNMIGDNGIPNGWTIQTASE